MNRWVRPWTVAALTLTLAATSVLAAEVGIAEPPQPNYTKAYVSMAGGLALTIGSFFVAEGADRAYQDYLLGTDPQGMQDDFNQSVSLDRLASAMLITGQAGLILGIYWRFIKRTPQSLPSESLARFATPQSQPRFQWFANPMSRRVGLEFRF